MNRIEGEFETCKKIDANRVVIHGVSRLGKTVMLAGAYGRRFAAVIASWSGEGGAALSRRNYWETIAHLMSHGFITLSLPVCGKFFSKHAVPINGPIPKGNSCWRSQLVPSTGC
jgi:hypothetical protein